MYLAKGLVEHQGKHYFLSEEKIFALKYNPD